MQKAAVGLDLGTTISVAAYVDTSGAVHVVKDQHGSPLVPSAVFFGDQPIVGRAASRLSEQAFDNFAEGFKRDFGKPRYRKTIRHCDVPPEVLTGFLVSHLAENVRHAIGELTEVVVTVPAFFDERQRTSTQRATALAGLKVLDIINEPTAAAIAAAYDLLKSRHGRTAQRILVYDLGGGTFDATLLEIDGRVFKTLGTDGDIYLGGRDFDEKLVSILAESFVSKHGIDPRSDPGDLIKLTNLACEIKHALSDREAYDATFEHAGLLDSLTLSRRMFEQAIAPLVERSLMTSQAVVTDAGLRWQDVDQILLVGGSSRIPLVRQRFASESGANVTLSDQPDELVARGAALYAAMRSKNEYLDQDSRFEVANVNAHSLGIQGVDLQTKQRVNKIIIPRNTPLPTSSTEGFPTVNDHQQNVRIRLLEGESENPIFCTALGQCVVHLKESLPSGTPVRVCCHYDANGTISVTADVPATKALAHVELRREGIAELEPLGVWRTRLCPADPNHPGADDGLKPAAATLGPDSDINELLVRLDQIHGFVGRKVAEFDVPSDAASSQKLLNQTQRETVALKRMIDLLSQQQQQQENPVERMQLQGHLARLRMAWNQTNQLYLHSCVCLGRAFLQEGGDIGNPSLAEEAARLEQWLDTRTAM